MKEKIINLSAKNRPYSSFFGPIHKFLVEKYTPLVSQYTETYVLTGLTLVWSGLVFLTGLLVTNRAGFFIALASLIFLQFITDIFDGAVGRFKNTGLIKWGFYADHFLDFIFCVSLIFAYTSFLAINKANLFLIFTLTLLFIAYELLMCLLNDGNLNANGYYGFGTIEMRFLFILMNLGLIFIELPNINKIIPFLLAPGFLFLFFQVWRTQRQLWQEELKRK